jgi:hypothetical protein
MPIHAVWALRALTFGISIARRMEHEAHEGIIDGIIDYVTAALAGGEDISFDDIELLHPDQKLSVRHVQKLFNVETRACKRVFVLLLGVTEKVANMWYTRGSTYNTFVLEAQKQRKGKRHYCTRQVNAWLEQAATSSSYGQRPKRQYNCPCCAPAPFTSTTPSSLAQSVATPACTASGDSSTPTARPTPTPPPPPPNLLPLSVPQLTPMDKISSNTSSSASASHVYVGEGSSGDSGGCGIANTASHRVDRSEPKSAGMVMSKRTPRTPQTPLSIAQSELHQCQQEKRKLASQHGAVMGAVRKRLKKSEEMRVNAEEKLARKRKGEAQDQETKRRKVEEVWREAERDRVYGRTSRTASGGEVRGLKAHLLSMDER